MTISVNNTPFDVKSANGTSVELQDFSVPAVQAARLKISYSDPKPTKDFVGTSKSEGKFTFRDTTGQVIGILCLKTSIRADVTEVARTAMLHTLAELAGHEKYANTAVRGQVPFQG